MITAENQCEGKVPYTSQEESNKACLRHNKRGGVRLSTYKCLDCGFYHYGHESKGKRLKPHKKSYRVEVDHKSKTHKASTKFIK